MLRSCVSQAPPALFAGPPVLRIGGTAGGQCAELSRGIAERACECVVHSDDLARQIHDQHSTRCGLEHHPQKIIVALRIDRDAPSVLVDDREVSLTALELRLLCTLYERRSRVQTRSVLLDDVWCVSGENATRTVDTHVKRLREKLGPAGAYIETIRGIGYRFIGAPPKQPP